MGLFGSGDLGLVDLDCEAGDACRKQREAWENSSWRGGEGYDPILEE